ncbi:MAG: hypothetical protein Q8M07_20885 [Prosthecobacter sp.]|nr:hypothetical protein [Prosthecobacter sp.]
MWLFGGFQCQKKPNAADLKQQADSAAFDQHHQQWEPWRKKALLKHWQVEAANGNTYLAEALESIDQLCKRASVQHRVNISLEDVLDGLEYEEILDEHIEAQRIMHSTDQAGELKDWLEWHPMK